jgi:hypothetical protein
VESLRRRLILWRWTATPNSASAATPTKHSAALCVTASSALASTALIHEVENPSLCKVGLTTTKPRARLSAMQSLNWRALKLAAALRVPDREKFWEIDRAIKARLSPFRRAGQWFAVDPDRIVSELHKAAGACGSTLAPEPALDYARGTRGGARPGAGRPKKTPEPLPVERR